MVVLDYGVIETLGSRSARLRLRSRILFLQPLFLLFLFEIDFLSIFSCFLPFIFSICIGSPMLIFGGRPIAEIIIMLSSILLL